MVAHPGGGGLEPVALASNRLSRAVQPDPETVQRCQVVEITNAQLLRSAGPYGAGAGFAHHARGMRGGT